MTILIESLLQVRLSNVQLQMIKDTGYLSVWDYKILSSENPAFAKNIIFTLKVGSGKRVYSVLTPPPSTFNGKAIDHFSQVLTKYILGAIISLKRSRKQSSCPMAKHVAQP